jgi:predicted nuclease of predicted toxin-antitoxin system
MKFICDVHISFKLVRHLKDKGHPAIHVNDILNKWYTKDKDISEYADKNDLILITKDADFKNSFLLHHTPKKLIKVNLGNISNEMLIKLISDNLHAMERLSHAKKFMMEIDLDHSMFVSEV